MGEEDAIAQLEEYANTKQMTLNEAMQKYDVVSSVYDPVHGSYLVMSERDPKMDISTGFREMGYSSPSPFTSWTRDERVPELRDQRGIRTYYDMKRADGTVRGALRLLKTPVMAARWMIEPASDSTIDMNIARFVEDNLFNKLNMPWHRVLEDALLMCEFGYSPLEKVYDVDTDGRIILKKLAPRHPLDILGWEYDDAGGPNGIVMNPTEANGWENIFIPIEKLVVFVLEQEAGDMRGISILRSAYKHYFYKDCVSEDTEILTQRGWLTHNKLIQDDMVMTINPETELSEWQPVQYIRRYQGTHDVIQMESQSLSAITTPDHRWLTKDATWSSSYNFTTTQNLRQRHIIPKAAVNADIPTNIKYTDDLVELVGWFITEGSWDSYGARISQNYDQPYFERIRICLNNVFGSAYTPKLENIGRRDMSASWYEHPKKHDPSGCQFRLNSAATKVLKEFVHGKNKIVTTDFILSMTKAQLELFVTTCIRGDGCGNNEIRQNDKARLEPIALACVLLGWGVNFNSWKHPDPNYPNSVVYQLTIARQRVGAKPLQSASRYGSSVNNSTYEGIVWCPKTENGTWLARRNGKVYFTGNTMYKIDAIQKERHGIGVPIIKLPAGASDTDKSLAEDLGRNLRTNERGHIAIPHNWEILFAKLEGQPVDCLDSIRHHDDRIMTNILAPFYDDPDAKEDSMGMFYKSTRYIASTVADTFNRYVIKQLVDFNFSRGGYPIVRARRIGEWEDIRTASFAIRNHVGAGTLTPDDVLEKFLRVELDLPPMDKATQRIMATPQNPLGEGNDPVEPSRVGPPRQKAVHTTGTPQKNAGTDQSGG